MLEISFVCCIVQFIMMSPTALRWQRHKRHCDGSGRTWLSLWTQNGYPTPRPYGPAVEYLLWRFEVNRPHYNGSAEYEGASKYNSQGLSNGLVPNIAKPLTEPVLTYCQLSIGHKDPPPHPPWNLKQNTRFVCQNFHLQTWTGPPNGSQFVHVTHLQK